MTARIEAVTMPAGRYIVGDPCYSVPDGHWMPWLEAAGYLDNPRLLVADIDGHTVVGVGTAHGDGEYTGSDRFDYPINAGLIGVMPLAVAGKVPPLTRCVEFTAPFMVAYEDGTIVLGDIRIDTEQWNEED